MKNKIVLLIICFFLCLFFSAADYPGAETGEKQGQNEVIVFGTCSMADGNLAQAKACAISNALIKGIERYLLVRIGKKGVVNNFQRLVRDIIPGSKEGIESFNILSEYSNDNEYNVLVHLKINENLINDTLRDAALVLNDYPDIKVLFLVSEVNHGWESFWWQDPESHTDLSLIELALHQEFQKRGFIAANRTSGIPANEITEDLRSHDLLDESILRWGRLFFADVVLYGKCESVNNNYISLTLKAFDVNKGVKICEGMKSGNISPEIENSSKKMDTIEKIVNLLASEISPLIIRSVTSDKAKIHTFTIILENISSFKQSKIFKDFLIKDINGLKSVIQTNVRGDSIYFNVDFQGDKDKFIQNVLNHENLPFPLYFKITEDGKILFEIEQATL
ncbi:MAG TPA: hypothetical protein PK874_08160 [Desulfobacteraceae bacterium]|nr:hypothetical protein [Desulfobacteraceae bacterium]HPJ67881.1 hypothetical protein [Desulfobacteraceae bacterium]HPQ30001.1 hypothetical protein [Desulfobacteraceae bacterium]